MRDVDADGMRDKNGCRAETSTRTQSDTRRLYRETRQAALLAPPRSLGLPVARPSATFAPLGIASADHPLLLPRFYEMIPGAAFAFDCIGVNS